ncbi:MAG TPA: alpha/beta hydrolase [Acidimicrobiia bacterium]|nr:alpha/beta hydrolase [Acidimicrobiia bacterium]
MSTFALIHGAWHGAWCWERLIPELEQRGHRAVAVDLPCDDPSVTTMENATLVADSLAAAGAGDDVVVVGHSLGGITAAVMPLLRPVRRVVLLAALVPRPGRSLNEVMKSEPDTTTEEFNTLPRHVGEDGAVTWDPEIAAPFFYRACDPDTARWAAGRLRPQVWTTSREPCPLDKWPDCELVSVICASDELLRPEWSRRIARDILGVAPVELPGGHFPMLSIPTHLAEALTA